MECIVCRRPGLPSTATQKKSSLKPEVLEDQLVVIYFFQKFFDVPVLIQDADVHGELENLEGLLRSLGNPVEWANFCSACCPMVRRAKALHNQLMKIKGQLRDLRLKVESKVREGYAGTPEEPVTRYFTTYLRTRMQRYGSPNEGNGNNAIINENVEEYAIISVKSEPLEIEGFEPHESPWSPIPNDDISSEDIKLEVESVCSLNLEDFVIDPVKGSPQRKDKKGKIQRCKAKRGTRKKTNTSRKSAKKPSKKLEIPDTVVPESSPPLDKLPSEPDEDLQDSEFELEASNDDSDDDDYVPDELEIPEAKKYVKLPKSRRKKPGEDVKERGHFVVCNGPRRSLKYVQSVSERTCPICQVVFTRKSQVKNHMNIKHVKEVLFTCDACQKVFYTRQNYTAHCKKHLTAEEIKHLTLANKLDAVKVDGVVVKTAEGSITEEAVEHGDGDAKEYSEEIVNQVLARTCPLCKKVFTDKKLREFHVESVHNKVKPYVCEKCGKAYITQSYLTLHLQRHDATTRDVKCNYPGCTANFKIERDLKLHEKIVHLRKFEKLCPHCGVKLGSNSALRRHIFTIHTENAPKNFKCEICSKEFLTKQRLTAHMKSRTHGGPGLKKRKWIPVHVRLQMKMKKGLIPQPQQTQQTPSIVSTDEPTMPENCSDEV